ncbi:hypothetical protein, partial [Burkholderia ambifaria]|uniref:hypothetical protein n=1 Tax=Burkholderia ambifaria TaxID=152480 RepID=UPI001E33A48E
VIRNRVTSSGNVIDRKPIPAGPIRKPIPRYTMAALSGKRLSDAQMSPMKISRAPKMRHPIVSVTLNTLHG